MWCDVVWCDVVWCGVVWCGVVCCVVLCCVVLCCVVLCCVVLCCVVLCCVVLCCVAPAPAAARWWRCLRAVPLPSASTPSRSGQNMLHWWSGGQCCEKPLLPDSVMWRQQWYAQHRPSDQQTNSTSVVWCGHMPTRDLPPSWKPPSTTHHTPAPTATTLLRRLQGAPRVRQRGGEEEEGKAQEERKGGEDKDKAKEEKDKGKGIHIKTKEEQDKVEVVAGQQGGGQRHGEKQGRAPPPPPAPSPLWLRTKLRAAKPNKVLAFPFTERKKHPPLHFVVPL